jgi:predicted phosphoribosyltransferase
VASRLDADLDIVVARKLRAPGNPELAIGAVTANGGQYLNDEYVTALGVSEAYLEREIDDRMEDAREREAYMRGGLAPSPISGRTVIVVDDGLATGATMRAALRSVRRSNPGRLVMAVPVGSSEAVEAMRAEADEVVCLSEPDPFYAVGLHYRDFEPVEEDEVRRLLEARSRAVAGGGIE